MSEVMGNQAGASGRDVLLRPRDPILARDGRPFGATPGAQAVSLPWPLPGTVAGALRTRIGTDRAFDWHGNGPDLARSIVMRGPLMLARRPGDERWTVYFMRPNDALVVRPPEGAKKDAAPRVHALRPFDKLPDGADSDVPDGLRPLRIPDAGKVDATRPYWPLDACVAWLADATRGESAEPEGALTEVPRETRMHVKIDPQTGAGEQGFLFATVGLAFADQPRVSDKPKDKDRAAYALLCRVSGTEVDGWNLSQPSTFITLGGERRLVELRIGAVEWPNVPAHLSTTLMGAQRLRLVLATPALFDGGWKPGWLDDQLEGSPPGLTNVRLRLVAAATGRRAPVSGWNMQRHKDDAGRWRERGPKAARYTVPTGSVYFFEVAQGPLDADAISRLWLAPLSDKAQDRADGYGLALPGVW